MLDPILLDFPYQFETERLLIRGPLPGDGEAIHAAAVESQPELRQWLPWAVSISSTLEYEVRVRKKRLEFLERKDLWLLLWRKASGSDEPMLIGSSGLHRIDWQAPSFEIGYWVRTSQTGQGYITEAVAGITHFAFETLGAQRVEIRCDARNTRSAAVPQRLGFALEGTLHNHMRHHLTGDLRDTLIFAKVASE